MPSGRRLIGPDEIRDRERVVARQDRDADLALGGDLVVDAPLDLADELTGHPLELEVHPAGAGLHVAAGDLRPVVPPDDAAQDVERRVGAHQQMPTVPVDLGSHGVPDRRRPRSRLQVVDDLALGLPGRADDPRRAIGSTGEPAGIGRLPAAARVEDRPVEDDTGALAGLDGQNDALDGARVRVRIAQLEAPGHRDRVPTYGAFRHRNKWRVSATQYGRGGRRG
jgi:hypothetical protein